MADDICKYTAIEKERCSNEFKIGEAKIETSRNIIKSNGCKYVNANNRLFKF